MQRNTFHRNCTIVAGGDSKSGMFKVAGIACKGCCTLFCSCGFPIHTRSRGSEEEVMAWEQEVRATAAVCAAVISVALFAQSVTCSFNVQSRQTTYLHPPGSTTRLSSYVLKMFTVNVWLLVNSAVTWCQFLKVTQNLPQQQQQIFFTYFIFDFLFVLFYKS